MDDQELAAILNALTDSVRRAEATTEANSLLLAEIVRDLADAARDRHEYLAGMSQRVTLRLDRSPIDKKPAWLCDLPREELSKLFAEVATRR
jgi:hypothetical protein